MAKRGRPRKGETREEATINEEYQRITSHPLLRAFDKEQYVILPCDGGYCLYDRNRDHKKANAQYIGRFYISTNGTIQALQEEPSISDIVDECWWKMLDPNIQYASREAGIKAHAEDYSFNIESVLFQQLSKEQQKLWRKEIEQACISGGYCGLNLGLDKRYDKEEPVSEKLGEYINELSKQFPEVSFAKLSRIAVRVAKWQKQHLWKPTNGDDLPEIDKEVIALEGLDEKNYYRVVFVHRVDSDRVIKTTIDNKPLELHPSKYGKAGWNLPNLKYWLDLELPNKNE